MDEIEDWEYD